MARSKDGSLWEYTFGPHENNVSFFNGRFLVASTGDGSHGLELYESFNGASWESVFSFTSMNVNILSDQRMKVSGQVIAVAGMSTNSPSSKIEKYLYSFNATEWFELVGITPVTGTTGTLVPISNGEFILNTRELGRVKYNFGNMSYTPIVTSTGSGSLHEGVMINHGVYYSSPSSTGRVVLRSFDGIAWDGYGGILPFVNGSTWKSGTAYSDDLMVIIGAPYSDGSISASYVASGNSPWIMSDRVFGSGYIDVIFDGSQFVMVGYARVTGNLYRPHVWSSEDGLTWNVMFNGGSMSVNGTIGFQAIAFGDPDSGKGWSIGQIGF